MVNPARGEIALEINGQSYALCLTLGGLAEFETWDDAPVSAARLLDALELLLRGGGNPLSRETLRDAELDIAHVATAIAQCFACVK